MADPQTQPIPYATPVASPRPLWAAAILGMLALGLIFLSGCFLIGIGIAYEVIGPQPVHHLKFSPGQYLFVAVLYLCSATTFVSGLWVALLAVRRLMTA